jgi:hypothetical protein
LGHSRRPCRPRTILRRALPDGVPPRGAFQGDQLRFAHSTDADDQTASSCLVMVRPPAASVQLLALGTEVLGPASGTRRRVRVTAVKLLVSTPCHVEGTHSHYDYRLLPHWSHHQCDPCADDGGGYQGRWQGLKSP